LSATFTYQHNNATYAVQLQPQSDGTFVAAIGGRTYAVRATHQPDGSWRLQLGGADVPLSSVTAYVATDRNTRFVKVGADPVILLKPEDTRLRSRARRSSTDDSGAQLIAQMPGQVVEVYVGAGDAVLSGQTLALLEAMKMEIRVTAPTAGVIAGVYVKPGDVVERDQRLIDLHPPAPPSE
jgi:biotin carboxyl carrier protein